MRTLETLWKEGTTALEQQKIQEARLDAWLLLEYVTGISRAYYFAHQTDEVEEKQAQEYLELIQKRAEHIPLQHLTHQAFFMGLEFYVNEHVLIPRQDTETLVEQVLELIKTQEEPQILDMCTGSGCILLSLLSMKDGARGAGVDISTQALEVAKKNAVSLNLQGKVQFIESDLFCAPFFQEKTGKDQPLYDILTSNPPYIRSDEIASLMEEVRSHDPLLALDGHEDGLYFYRKIVSEGIQYLKKDGWLVFEIGYDQGQDVKELLLDGGFVKVQVIKDLCGMDRVVLGQKA